jgi:hypothetical protein
MCLRPRVVDTTGIAIATCLPSKSIEEGNSVEFLVRSRDGRCIRSNRNFCLDCLDRLDRLDSSRSSRLRLSRSRRSHESHESDLATVTVDWFCRASRSLAFESMGVGDQVRCYVRQRVSPVLVADRVVASGLLDTLRWTGYVPRGLFSWRLSVEPEALPRRSAVLEKTSSQARKGAIVRRQSHV